jgi:uncharacterized protein YegP (UPF0339 family)
MENPDPCRYGLDMVSRAIRVDRRGLGVKGGYPMETFEIYDTWAIYQDERGDWRWKRTAPGGAEIEVCAEGYDTRADCVENAKQNGYTGIKSAPPK